MSAERDAGLAAMQSGDTETAIRQLELATQQDANDYQAAMYLGAAYGQAKRHADAVGILTKAVQIEPANPQARYNLGIAMEQGGWVEQAKQAYEQALTLQPDYAKAQEALGRTQAMLGTPQPVLDPMNMPTTAMTAQPGYVSQQPTHAPPTQQQPVYAPPTQQGYGQPQPAAYGAPPPSPYGQPQPAYGAVPNAPQQVAMYPAQSQYHEDSFSIKDAFRDWKEVLFSPRTFWQRQADSDGFSAPLAMNVTTLTTTLVVIAVMAMLFIGLRAPIAIPVILIGFVMYLLIGGIFLVIGNFILSGLLFLTSKIFGSRGTFAGAYRSVSYAYAPYFLYLTLGLGLMVPIGGSAVVSFFNDVKASTTSMTTNPRSTNPFGSANAPGQPTFNNSSPDSFTRSMNRADSPLVALIASLAVIYILFVIGGLGIGIWVLVLLGMGIAHTQKISTGAAIGTIVLGVILPYILLMVAYFSLFGATMVARGGQ